jgi:hypothetical protein
MHDYPFDVTTVRLAVIVGVLFTTVFYERIQLTTGGAIVPGYLALFITSPPFHRHDPAPGVSDVLHRQPDDREALHPVRAAEVRGPRS